MELDIKPRDSFKRAETKRVLDQRRNHSINLYMYPPDGRLTIEECEDLFRQRLEALTLIEKSADTSEAKHTAHADLSNLLRSIKSHVFNTNCILLRANDIRQHKLDHFSHMLTRMYCIHNQDLWQWFRSSERKLLYYRLRDQANSLSGGQLETILRDLKFEFERVTTSEVSELHKENLVGWSRNLSERENIDIFKVKFTSALRFIARRSVGLKNGFAFLTTREIVSVVCDVFERHLDSELRYARQHFNTEVGQTQQLLEALELVYLEHKERQEEERRAAKRGQEGDHHNPFRIDIENLDQLAKDHFPPCMRHLHENFTQEHHMKHYGRLYYATFLRSGGVDMDSTIEFYRREFTKKIPNDRFEREYKYNIRHIYGREGHKKALSCFSCDKIINDNAPGPSEAHGCPFKHFDDNHLKVMLAKHGLNGADVDSVIRIRDDKEYKSACSNYFKMSKGEFPSEPIKTPIHFYMESMRLANRPRLTEEEEAAKEMNDDDMIDLEPTVGSNAKSPSLDQ